MEHIAVTGSSIHWCNEIYGAKGAKGSGVARSTWHTLLSLGVAYIDAKDHDAQLGGQTLIITSIRRII